MHLPQVEEFGKVSEQLTRTADPKFPVIEAEPKTIGRRNKIFSPLAGIIGASLLGFGAFGVFWFQNWLENKFPSEIQVEIVPHAELNQVANVIDPKAGEQAFKEAKSCSVPLIYAVVKLAPGHFVQTFRIRSGAYLSPPIVVTDAPQRVPFPAPGPFPNGYGTIGLEGQFDGVQIWRVSQVWGEGLNSEINKSLGFHWTPGPEC